MRESLEKLRGQLAALERMERSDAGPFTLGAGDVDSVLGAGGQAAGLARGTLHEVYAAKTPDAPAASGFSLALAMQAASGKPVLWARHDFAGVETGGVYAPGLAELGLDVGKLIFVRVRSPADVLRVGGEAAACAPLGAVLLEIWGSPRELDLTASRRLSFAAAASGVTVVMMRAGASPIASAASTRWLVRGAPSKPFEADAPGRPAFAIELLRHRNGVAGRGWIVEWDRDRRTFTNVSPLAGGVAAIPAGRRAASAGEGAGRPADWRKAG